MYAGEVRKLVPTGDEAGFRRRVGARLGAAAIAGCLVGSTGIAFLISGSGCLVGSTGIAFLISGCAGIDCRLLGEPASALLALGVCKL